jgi:PA14 domain
MFKVYAVFIILMSGIFLIGCGKKTKTEYVVSTASVPAAPVVVDEVARVVDEVNTLRLNQGSAPLVPGLVCSLYNNTGAAGVFPNSATAFPASLPSAVGSWVYLGDINQPDSSVSDGLNILPVALRSVYKTDYALRCSGQLVVTKSDYYSFSLRSDDAGLLYVGGSLVTGLNTLHAPTATTGVKFLARGIHSIRVDYMQDSGQQSLQLNVPGSYLYR